MFNFNKAPRISKQEEQGPSSPPSTQQILADADQARDERRWSDAADLYGKYLAAQPRDAAIWVQFGHALKESGNLDEAEGAYRRGFELAPNVADTQLQLGHLYKRARNFANAIEAYRAALRIDGSLVDAKRELIALKINPDDGTSLQASTMRGPGIFLDLSDVFFYLKHHKTVSGIQRVQLGIAQAIIAMNAADRSGTFFLSETDDRSGYVVIDDVFVLELSGELSRAKVEHSRLLAIMRSAIECARPYELVTDDTLLILGAFWVLENIAERIIALRRAGVRVGTLIHDIIPITHPEFCETSLTDSFTSYFFSVVRLANFILTVSDYSGRRVQEFMSRNGITDANIRTLRSAHQTWDASTSISAPASASTPAIAQLLKENYVLYVSTIEIRKNHTYLFRIWKRLLQERGDKTPRLVFVGRPGWRVRDLMDQIESTQSLGGKLLILHDLSDATLAALYSSAMFTVFPSFEEGWGLPVGESLLFGRPCIAANASSIPEVAGDFVDYVDPFNLNEGYGKIVRFIDDREFRESRAAHIKKNFKPRGWPAVADDMLRVVRALATESSDSAKALEPPTFKPSIRYQFGHSNDISHFISSGGSTISHLVFGSGWYPIESFGRWMKGHHSSLEFQVEPGVPSSIIVILDIIVPEWLKSTRLQITANEETFSPLRLDPGKRQRVPLHLSSVKNKVLLEFSPIGEIAAGQDERPDLCFGICSIGYASAADISERMSLLEQFVYDSPPLGIRKGSLFHDNSHKGVKRGD